MPLTGDPDHDIPELTRHGKRKRSRKQIAAIALAEQRRRSGGGGGQGKAKGFHPWLVKAAQWEEGKHRRDHGKFSRTAHGGGAGGGSGKAGRAAGRQPPPLPRRKPVAPSPGSRDNPDLDAAMGMSPAPARPAAVRADPFAEYETGTQNLREFPKRPQRPQPPELPHQRTQQSAIAHAEMLRNLTAIKDAHPETVRVTHRQAVAALNAHLNVGLTTITQMARERYGDTPKARHVALRAAAAFKAKLSNVRRRLDQMAGTGPPPLPGKRPPPLPGRGVPVGPKRPPPLPFRRKAFDAMDLDPTVEFAAASGMGALRFAREPAWLTKSAHDVSGELRDDKGQWTAGGDSTPARLTAAIAHVSAFDPGDITHHRGVADRAVAELSKLPQATVYAHLKDAGLEGIKPSDSKKGLLARLHRRLTAPVRARERAEV